jgi:hypothetical protein
MAVVTELYSIVLTGSLTRREERTRRLRTPELTIAAPDDRR